ncbi:NAD(P)(+)--arginine ADP-ribosyltransferase 2-like [Mastacembelus armatus]|uniref:NAD(P)(+)--arginine ADP-ribosyltransferase 2-like n=1 Tax=Mastacembelus armatus TaxID=205130 RepID=UPI000E45C83C|nr:NAD(P)(+)--arginine ADP-ribosyltransferase 2-like [Mastacembelus armatus]
MKGNMLILAPLCLLLLWMLPVDSMGNIFIKPKHIKQVIPLNMAEDSVDDMYFGCSEEMMKKVEQLNSVQNKYDKEFAGVWKRAEQCASEKRIKDEALTKEQLEAICAFTSNDIYGKFNDAVRNDGKNYPFFFHFPAFHFLLTSAIQSLNDNKTCLTAYRRTNDIFTGSKKQMIRFGSFASSSLNTTLTDFGNETCFQIKTCSGAYLKHYSVYPSEDEVLIPPYEVFKITKKIMGKNKIKGLHDCKRVYILESAGGKSTLNCKAACK